MPSAWRRQHSHRTHAEGVELVAVAIAIAFRDVSTSALEDFTRCCRRRKRRAHPRNRRCHRRCHRRLRCQQSPPHTPKARAGFNKSRSRRQMSASRKVDRARTLQCHKRQAIQRSRLRRRRCHPHQRSLRSHRHTRPRRRVGCHHSRSRLRDVSTSALVDLSWLQTPRRAHPRSRPHRHRCHRRQRPQCIHRHTRRGRRAGCRHSRSRLLGCHCIRIRRSSWPLQMPQASSAPTQSSTSSQMPSLFSFGAVTATHTQGVELVRHSRSRRMGCQHIRTRKSRQDRCRCRAERTHIRPRHHRYPRPRPQCSRHHTRPRRRVGFRPSQSPAGMSAHPHSKSHQGRRKCRRRRDHRHIHPHRQCRRRRHRRNSLHRRHRGRLLRCHHNHMHPQQCQFRHKHHIIAAPQEPSSSMASES